MPATLSVTESDALAATRAFLQAFLPAGIEVIDGQGNLAAEPAGPDFVVMTPILRTRLSTNVTTYADGFYSTPPVPGTRSDLAPTDFTVQLDVHGPNSGDNAQIITTLFRSDVGTTTYAASGYDVTPLYCDEARQLPFVNAESQYEDRWSIDAHMQLNALVGTPQQFADKLVITPVDADIYQAVPPSQGLVDGYGVPITDGYGVQLTS